MYGTVLQDHLEKLRNQAHDAHGYNPLSTECRAEAVKPAKVHVGESKCNKEQDVQVYGQVNYVVADIESNGSEVEGQRVKDADAFTEEVVVARADDCDAPSGNLGEEVRCRVESGLAALLELQCVNVRRGLLTHAHIVTGKDVLAEVHHRRALAHAAPVPGPEAVHEVGVAVVHARADAAEEPLVDRAEGPLGGRVALAHGALAAGEDVLAEADVAGRGGDPIALVQGHEEPQHVGHLEALADEDAHVAVHGLHVVA
mmetsp:Transcript_109450/g.266050  ORF Transcript_109450/g.266050 Transcript_109450/m.266050 type:complete len:257 (+) Transcript_109450:1527-2297(+)